MPRIKKKTSRRTSARPRGSPASPSGSVEAALGAIERAVTRVGGRWYLFGAQAVAIHGVPRTTQDIDVTVLVDCAAEELVRALRAEGISPKIHDADFIASTRVGAGLVRARGRGYACASQQGLLSNPS